VSEGNLLSDSKIIKSWGAGCDLQALFAFNIFMVIVAGIVGTIILSVLLPITDSQRIYIWLILPILPLEARIRYK